MPTDFPEARERIKRIRKRYQTGENVISIERARYYTENWRKTEGQGLTNDVRVAMAVNHVYENMTHYVDPDDRLAGCWTENFLGVPIDIERGLFNNVFAAELNLLDMVLFRVKSFLRAGYYITKNGTLFEWMKNMRLSRAAGDAPLNMELKTMDRRQVNPFKIRKGDRKKLLRELLPFWRGKTLIEKIEKALSEEECYSSGMADFAVNFPGLTSKQAILLSSSMAMASYQCHIIPDFDQVLQKGLLGLQEEVTGARSEPGLTETEDDYLHARNIALDGMITFARRLAGHIEGMIRDSSIDERPRLEQMLSVCRKVPLSPPDSFLEAVQSLWATKTILEVANPIYMINFGRLDQSLLPYFRRDLDSGRLTVNDARELIEELMLKNMSHQVRPESNIVSNFYHRFTGASPVTLAGLTPEGDDATNELTYLFVQAAHNSRTVCNCNIRVTENTPDDLLLLVADCLRRGTSSYALFNDEVYCNALRNRKFLEDDVRNHALMCCVESTIPGKTGNMSANALLLSHLLDCTLRGGNSKMITGTIENDGLRTRRPEDLGSFEEFKAVFLTQARHAIEKIVVGSNIRDRVYAENLPAPHMSTFIQGCLESKKDLTRGGSKYEITGISFINSIANLVDSLWVIKNLIYERKRFTFEDLLNALDDNFVGHDRVRQAIEDLEGKWGNGNPEIDDLAREMAGALMAETGQYRTFRGGQVVNYVVSMTTHTVDGRMSAATPDGRLFGRPFAASCNPANVERSGVTGVLRSVARLPFEDCMGAAINVRFHPSAIGHSDEARKKWVSLVRTYFKMGGAQIQPTVVSREMVEAAMKDPDAHRDLIVKVGGYSVYFVDLGPEIQSEILARTEHIAC